jgi:dTDP-4-amino-4,6-dideoxygalactose transaminase
MANGIYKVTEDFEKSLSDYTGAPYVVTVDNQSNALFLSLYYEKNIKKSINTDTIKIPSRTYPSVPCEIIHAGLKVDFEPVDGKTIKELITWWVVMFGILHLDLPLICINQTHICVFHLQDRINTFKLSKGGAILTDNYEAYLWFKRARYSGRRECSYHDDNFDMLGWNFYMMPELATRGLLLMNSIL